MPCATVRSYEDEIRSVEGPDEGAGTPIPVRVGGLVLVSKGVPEHSARVRGCEPSASYRLEPLGGCLRA